MTTDYNRIWPQSGAIEHLPFREQVRILMECTRVRYPHANIGPDTIAAFKSDWAGLLREVGSARFQSGLERAVQSTSFFPVLADIVKHIPPPRMLDTFVGLTDEDRRRKAAGERSYGVPDIRCLAVLQQKLRAKVGRPLYDAEVDSLLVELNRLIDLQEKSMR